MGIRKEKRALRLQGNLQHLLDSLVGRGFELGLQVAVYLDGELVADVSAGHVSSGSSRMVDSNTLFPVCSTGKGILSTMLHILASRGVINYDRPIIKYWPEFGLNGKAAVTVRQALSHMAGIPQTPRFKSLEEACNWNAACAKVAEMTPSWTPGSKAEYHSRSFGWILGGIIERAAKRPFKSILRDEITHPLCIEDSLFFGTSDDAETRVSPFEAQATQKEQCSTAPATPQALSPETASALALPIMDFVNMPEVRRSCMPALNGIMSAKAIAKHYAALIGKVDGVRLIPESVLEKATTLQTPPASLPACFGHGFGLGYVLKGMAPCHGSFFGHGGAGGSEGMANRGLRMAVGLTKNRMDTHSNALNHTCVLVMNEIMSILGNNGDGGFYKLIAPNQASTDKLGNLA